MSIAIPKIENAKAEYLKIGKVGSFRPALTVGAKCRSKMSWKISIA